jgi:hypothetical protein
MFSTDIGRFFLVIVFVIFVGLVVAVELASAKLEMDRLVLWEGMLSDVVEEARERISPTPPSALPSQVMCAADVKQCPDGSYVGRTGPHCEFAPCPGS